MQPKRKRREEVKAASKGTLIAIYNSIDLLASCFPESAYRLYQEDLLSRNEFIDEVLRKLHVAISLYTDYEPFIPLNEPLRLSDRDYSQIYSWIVKTTVYQKHETWHKAGVRNEADIIAMIDRAYVKSVQTYNELLEEGAESAAQMVGIGIRNIVDFTGIRARNEANYIYKNECDRIEQNNYLEKDQ